LDCRFLAASHPKTFKILSVTTIATPHRGSCFAEYFLETLGKGNIPSLVSFLEYLPNGGGDGKAFEGLTREAMRKFNEEVKDADGVAYYR
jgi:triacylglycerol lipase